MNFVIVAMIAIMSGVPVAVSQNLPVVPETEKIFYKSGEEIRLKCPKNESHRYMWESLKCGIGNIHEKCRTVKNIPEENLSWVPKCETDKCKHTLKISNASQNDSGLYRCSVQHAPHMIGSIILKTFEIYVVDLAKNDHIPEFLSNEPSNITGMEHAQVILRCSVFSVIPVKINWLKEVDADFRNHSLQTLHYANKTYVQLNTSGTVELSDDIYLSKLTLSDADEYDSGFYTCLAINSKGMNFMTISLKVICVRKMHDVEKNIGSFSALFLIPVALALIPITIWICYYRRRRRGADTVCENNQYASVRQRNNDVTVDVQTDLLSS